MFRPAPAHPTKFGILLLTLSILYGCSDAPLPVAPRLPATPQAFAGPVATVTNTDDSGPGSLRDAIAAADPGTTIQFDPSIAGQTIVLTTALEPDQSMTIEGPAGAGVTISGGLTTRVLVVATGTTVTLRNLTITNGRHEFGAGILVAGGSAILDHVLVANNEAVSDGGGITVKSGDLVVVNSTISGNTALIGGGFISSGNVILRNSTIAENTSASGGGLYTPEGSITFRNTIIADNIDSDPGATPEADCRFGSNAAVAYVGANLSSDGSCGSGPSMLTANPKIGSLTNNGGPTQTHGLLGDSPAIDAGVSCTETSDQRYVSRPQGPSCDIGAFEFTDYGTYQITIGPNIAVNRQSGVATVSGTISCSKETGALLRVRLSQTQKTTGKFTTIIQGDALASVTSCSSAPVSWSVAVMPDAGKFENGSASGRATTEPTPPGYLIGDVTTPVKLFWVK